MWTVTLDIRYALAFVVLSWLAALAVARFIRLAQGPRVSAWENATTRSSIDFGRNALDAQTMSESRGPRPHPEEQSRGA